MTLQGMNLASEVIHGLSSVDLDAVPVATRKRNLNIHLIRMVSWGFARACCDERNWQATADLATVLLKFTDKFDTAPLRWSFLANCARTNALPVEAMLDGDYVSEFASMEQVPGNMALKGSTMIWESILVPPAEELLAQLTTGNHVCVYVHDRRLHQLPQLLRLAHTKYGVELKDPAEMMWLLESDFKCGYVSAREKETEEGA